MGSRDPRNALGRPPDGAAARRWDPPTEPMTSAIASEQPPFVAALEGDSDVVLRDGSTVHLRPVGPGDVSGIAAFLHGLSQEARWFRFMGLGVDLDRAASELVGHGTGLLAVAGPDDEIVA